MTPSKALVAAVVAISLATINLWAVDVTYTTQTGDFNSLLNEKNNNPPYAGTYNNTATELGQYANGGSFGNTPGAAAFETFTTTGNGNTGVARALQIGDTFTITAYSSSNPSAGGYMGISFRDSTTYTNFFSSTDSATEARFQLDNTGGWKVYSNGATVDSGLGSGADRTFTIKITSLTTFDATIGGTTYYNQTMAAGGGSIDSFSIYTLGDSNPNSFWKNAALSNTGTVQLGYAAATGAVFTPGQITDGLAADSTSTASANAVFIGGDAGSQVNLSAANTYTGTTTINANAVGEAQNASALGSTAAGTTVASGGSLHLYSSAGGITYAAEALTLNGVGISGVNGALRSTGGNNTWTGGITLGSNSRIQTDTTGGGGSLAISGNITGGSNVLFLGANGAAISVSGAISGTGASQDGTTTSLYKDGVSDLTLTGNNTYTGDTRVAAGNLQIASTGSISSSSTIYVGSGATTDVAQLTLSKSDGGQTISNAMTVNPTSGGATDYTKRIISSANTSGTNTFSGTIIVNNDVALSAASGGTLAFGLLENGSGVRTAHANGAGTVVLQGSSDNLNIALAVDSGVAQLAKASSSSVHAVGNSAGTALTVNSGGIAQLAGTGGDQIYNNSGVVINSGGVFDLNGKTETISSISLAGTGIGNTGALINSSGTAATLTLTGSSLLAGATRVG